MRTECKSRAKFVPEDFIESNSALSNPACGWYHVYTFQAQPPLEGQPVAEEVWLDESCQRERLALVLIDIGAFRAALLSDAALNHISQIMEFFHGEQKQMLLRFAYDTQGKGLEREPASLAIIKGHMKQIGEAIGPHLEDILVIQGIFVGNWGEMHGSKFLDEVSMRELVGTLHGVTKGRCFLAVRTPAQWRTITGSPGIKPEVVRRLGLFNDGIFGSPTDMGTYGTLAGAGRTAKWSRDEELEWQDRNMGAVPNGGEILSCYPLKGFRQAEQDLQKMHVCYLNSIYHPTQLEHWKKEAVTDAGCWQGISGYDYIARHLGYRFLVVDVAETWRRKLRITIKNCGFGNLCQEADCFLVIENGQDEIGRQNLDADAREWESGYETVLFVAIPPEKRCADNKLYLLLRRRSDGKVLHFANRDAEEKVLLGQYC